MITYKHINSPNIALINPLTLLTSVDQKPLPTLIKFKPIPQWIMGALR